MIGAIVLAAGLSRRMGTQKLLLPFGGASMIAHIVDQVLASVVEQVIVVVGRDGEAIEEALGWRSVTIVTNPAPDSEMLDSVRCGLRALPEECKAALVALGDQPAITANTINEMAQAFLASGRGIVMPVHEGRRGHPLLFSLRFRDEVLTQYDDTGLRWLLHAHPDEVYELSFADPGVIADVDLPEDYRRALEAHQPPSP